MAEPGLTEIETTTLKNRTRVLKDNVSNNNAAFAKGKEYGMFDSRDGGYVWLEEMAYDENDSFLWYEGSQRLDPSYNPTMTSASFTPRQSAVSVVLTGREKLFNSGEDAQIKLLASRIKIAEYTTLNKINASFYGDGTGSGGKEPGGLDLLIAQNPATGTVGGIDRSTAGGAFYRNYSLGVVATFGAALNVGNAKQVYNRAVINTTRQGEDMKSRLALLGNTYFEIVMNAAQAIQRIQDTKLAALGYENVMFCGIPFCLGGGVNFGGETLIEDTDSYIINTRYLKFCHHKDCFMDPLDERFSVNQDASVKYIASMVQFTLSNAKLQARVYDS